MKQVHILIIGFVQGIGYRSWVKSRARNLEVKGWIRNLSDGKVEILFQGGEEKLKEIISLCKEGPPMAEVDKIEEEWQEVKEKFDDFEVKI